MSALEKRLGSTAILRLLVLLSTIPVFGDTVTLQPSADTTLFENRPDNNLGASDLASGTIRIGLKSRALIRFDLSGKVPPNATITSAEVRLRVSKTPPSPAPSTFSLHRVFQTWEEGSNAGIVGGSAAAGEATWNARFFPGTPWSAPGAAAPADYTAKASATRLVAGLGSYTFASTPDMIANVQAWLTDPNSNFGWILISQSENVPLTARRFASREDGNNAPTLVIEFSASPQATAPSITGQPQSQTVNAGASVSFTATAGGTEPLGYQWKFNGNDIPGAAGPTLTLSNVQSANAGSYTIVISNAAGSVTSSVAILTVNQPTLLSFSVSDAAITEGNSGTINAVFIVSLSAASSQTVTVNFATSDGTATSGNDYVSRSGTLTFLPGLTNQVISIQVIGDNFNEPEETFLVSLSNPVNASISRGQASGTILNDDLPLSITTQPQSQTVTVGGTASFTTTAVGSGTLRYQWKFHGTDITGATNSTFTLSNVQPSNAGNYTVVVTDSGGSATSSAATLTVPNPTTPPAITQQPQSQTVNAGENATFTVSATGTEPLGYQWRFNGNPLAGATSPSLVLTNVSPDKAGSYSVVVSNPAGSVTSDAAVLTVTTLPEQPPRFDRMERVANSFNIVFTVEPTYELALEFADAIPSPIWTTLTNVAARTSPVVVTFPDSAGLNAQRFYRLKVTGRSTR